MENNDHFSSQALLKTLWAIKGSLDRIAEAIEYEVGKR